ncbi:MAG: copper chaperone PCu(A)C [Rhodospirillales bacterium]|jgi:hypothetical protein|nr:copper chaperone PCu(A)C [Rhodospirillales bacterium]
MKKSAIFLLFLAGFVSLGGTARADGGVKVTEVWARATPSMARNGVAHLSVTNHGSQADRLTGASSPVAKRASLHTHIMKDKIMMMRPVKGVDLAPGATIRFKPGGLHVMLMGLKTQLKKGASFPLTLTFEKAGKVKVTARIESIAAMGPGKKGGGHKGHGGSHGRSSPGEKTDHSFKLAIAGGKLTGGSRTLRVKEGEMVRFDWTADHGTEIHLHGYDKKTHIKPGQPAHTRFKARATGRFPVTLHHGKSEKPLFYLEVHPR